jgi:hypothetical protein
MPRFDQTLSDNVGTVDFSKYANLRALLRAKKWPPALVPLDTIADDFDLLSQFASGWRPSKAELKTAPTLFDWKFIDHTNRGQGVRLIGICHDHPILRGARIITTSHIVAMDLEHYKWARTLSRFYKLSRIKPSA